MHDHALLADAARKGVPVVGLFVFDPAWFRMTPFGFRRTLGFRGRFLREAVGDLRERLAGLGVTLAVRVGDPVDVVLEFAREVGAGQVWAHTEPAVDEVNQEKRLARLLRQAGIWFRLESADTLVHLDDLGYPVAVLPGVFTKFRAGVEKRLTVRRVATVTGEIRGLEVEGGAIPELSEFGVAEEPDDPRAVARFRGGETAGLERVRRYVWDRDCLRDYKETRNGMLGEDYSSKFSPWLAHGCLSPREVFWQVQAYERERVKNDSTYWLIFELLWRDFFHFAARQAGARLFRVTGLQEKRQEWSRDREAFERWRTGQTGEPLVDANMRELLATGFMSNRGRQIVASVLTKGMGVDWRWGARWFEAALVDYDPASNYGNWQYVAGVGHDPMDRVFNVAVQAKKYDARGRYVRHWLG